MAIYGYIRVSTTEQAEGTSLEDQGCRISGTLMADRKEATHVFRDEGVSGSTPLSERPQGKALMAALRSGDTVIAAKMDRLFRSAQDALNTVERLKQNGVQLILVDMGSGAVTENGVAKMFFTILAAVSEFERGRILERMSDGRKGKKVAGGHIGGQAPFGRRVVGAGREAVLEPDGAEQAIIERAKELRAMGKSFREICTQLTREGLFSRNGTPFASTQVLRMLK
jgi:DNA invertase Pin-like site-specific DNA recombinase